MKRLTPIQLSLVIAGIIIICAPIVFLLSRKPNQPNMEATEPTESIVETVPETKPDIPDIPDEPVKAPETEPVETEPAETEPSETEATEAATEPEEIVTDNKEPEPSEPVQTPSSETETPSVQPSEPAPATPEPPATEAPPATEPPVPEPPAQESSGPAKESYMDTSGLTGTQADVGKVVGYNSFLQADVTVTSVVESTTADGLKIVDIYFSDGTANGITECEYCHSFPCPYGGGSSCPSYDVSKDYSVTCPQCSRPIGDGYGGTCYTEIDWDNGGALICNHFD